jgi:hypothetical protein
MQQVVFLRTVMMSRKIVWVLQVNQPKRYHVMSLTELRPAVRALPPGDKYLLVQELLAELAGEEGVVGIEYPVWSPYEAHAAAATLLKLLEQEKASTP